MNDTLSISLALWVIGSRAFWNGWRQHMIDITLADPDMMGGLQSLSILRPHGLRNLVNHSFVVEPIDYNQRFPEDLARTAR